MTINTKYARLLSATKHYIFLLLIASLFILASCDGSNLPANSLQSNLSIADATALESAGAIEFIVSLNALFIGSEAITFNYETLDSSSASSANAIAGTDYTNKAGRATIDIGKTTTSILIDISNDTLVEDIETFELVISSPQPNIPISRARATATIEIDELPSLSITDATALEGAGSIKFIVSLSAPFPGNIVSFDYKTIEIAGSAIAGADYTSKTGRATIDIGELTTSILIDISNDSEVEDIETFELVISSPQPNIPISRARATATIENDDLPSLSIADATALESAGSIKFIVSLSALFPSNIVSFNYRTIPSSASANLDYTSVARTTSIQAGDTTAEIFINIINDDSVEDDETFYLEISSPQPNIPISRARATATIKIDELPSLSIADATALESAGSIKFTVSLSESFPGNIVSFDYHTTTGSAIAGADYTSKSGRATIDSGELTTSILIEINDDSLVEDTETFELVISNPQPNIPITRARATGTIKINGLSLSIADATALEGAGSIKFIVSLNALFPSNLVSFNYRTIPSSASANLDYTSVARTTSIQAGDTTAEIIIAIINDDSVEDDETFYLEISSPQPNIPISRARATATIENDDLPSLSIADATALEGAGSMKFIVSLSALFPSNLVSFNYRTIPSSASANLDYTSVVETTNIQAGDTTAEIFINIINDDSVEDDETFYLEISSPQPNIPISRARATATIENDELPSLSIADATALESAGSIKFTVSLSESFPGNIVSFDYATIAGSAIADLDYTSTSDTTSIQAGDTTAEIIIAIINDASVEDDETFYLEISSPQPNIQISRARATATIENDELPSLSIADATVLESAGSIKFTVSLSAPFPGNIVSFDYRTIPSSASANLDYTSVASTTSIQAGDTTAEIFINIINDDSVEDDETFLVEISSPQLNIPISRARATATIKINDLSLSIADATTLENAGSIKFRVSLSALFPGSKAVTFNYETTEIAGGASAGTDYTSVVAGRATINSGELATSIMIDINDDNLVEDDETFLVEISHNQLDIPIIKPQATGTIKIDDKPSLSITDATTFENAGVLTFRASLNEPFPGNLVSFDYQTKSGSANNKIVWQQATTDASWDGRDGHSSVVFQKKMWVMGGSGKNDVWHSTNGIKWVEATPTAGWNGRSGHSSVVFDGEIWVLGGNGGGFKNDVWRSEDGITWTRTTEHAGWTARQHHSSVVFEDKIWVLGGVGDNSDKNDVWRSTDGINWSEVTTSNIWSARQFHSSVVFDGEIWVLGGLNGGRKNDVWHSTDGINWVEAIEHANWSDRYGNSSVVFDDKIWVLGGFDGIYTKDVYYSADGVHWNEVTTNSIWDARRGHSSVVFDDKIWVMGGWDDIDLRNDVWFFADTTGDYFSASGSGSILGGERSTTIDITLLDDDILELADESFDIIISNPINATINTAAGDNQATGTILADAASWSEATTDAAWAGRDGHSSVVFQKKMWVMGGSGKNDVWHSANGIKWVEATPTAGWNGRDGHSSVVFDGEIWVLGGNGGGFKNDVWRSEDGITWTRTTEHAGWSERQRHSSVVFEDEIWVLGGQASVNYKNDVWRSTDGINWSEVTTSNIWIYRYGHSSVVFDDKIWVLGGYDDSNKRDVWHSTDGINWVEATTDAAWSARYGHSSVVFDDKIWVLGGVFDNSGNNDIYKNDVWYSADGVNWNEVTTNSIWNARRGHSSVVFDDKIWVMGGWDNSALRKDVWFFGELDKQ